MIESAPEPPAPPAPDAPRFVVEMRDGSIHGFGDIVSAKRFLDRSDDATRAIRASDSEVMARKTRVADAEMAYLASMCRK